MRYLERWYRADAAAARVCKSCAESSPLATRCILEDLDSRSVPRLTFAARRCTCSSVRSPSARFQVCCYLPHQQISKCKWAYLASCHLVFPSRRWGFSQIENLDAYMKPCRMCIHLQVITRTRGVCTQKLARQVSLRVSHSLYAQVK